MAMPLNRKMVSSKIDMLMAQIDFLTERKDHIQTLVDDANELLHLATSWLRNDGDANNLTYTKIIKMIDSKIVFLLSSDDSSVDCEKAIIEQESTTTRPFPTGFTFTDQPMSSGYDQVSATSDELKTIVNQLKVMQDAMSFLSSNSEKLLEKQLAMEKFVESLSEKYSKIEQEKIREIVRELKSISEKQKKAEIQQDKRMTSFEKKMRAVRSKQLNINTNLQKQQTRIEDIKKEADRLQKQSQKFTQDLKDNVKELSTQISDLDNKIIITGNIQTSSSEAMSIKFEEQSLTLKEFMKKTDQTCKHIPSVLKSEFKKLQKFEEQISAFEKSRSETSQESEKLYQDVKTKLNSVCDQMAVLLPKFSQLEMRTKRQAIGFSASLSVSLNLVKSEDTIIFSFISNCGNHFNPTKGEFTAPLDGLYAVSLSVFFEGNGSIEMNIMRESHINTIYEMCVARIVRRKCLNNSHASTFVLVDLKAYDKLYVQNVIASSGIQLLQPTTFSCVKFN